MPYTKTIVCLANSRKPGGHCVAGREVSGTAFGPWLRPVSARQGREIADDDERYRDGLLPSVLDLIEITLKAAAPEQHQVENHIIDDSSYWVRRGRMNWDQLAAGVEQVNGPLWVNDHASTYGRNDRVAETELANLGRSLYLIEPKNLQIRVAEEGAQYGNPQRRVRAHFDLAGHSYIFAVTDPIVEREYFARPNGDYRLKEALLCVSLGEVFHSYAYKLVAAVITRQRAGG